MYRHAPAATIERSWLWHHPLRIAAAAYALGTVASTASLGLTAVLEEQSARADDSRLLVVLAVGAIGAVLWASFVALALTVRPWLGAVVLVLASGATTLPKLFILALGSMEGMRPSIFPRLGNLVAVVSDPLLIASFVPVLRLARRVDTGDTEEGPLDVALAASGWLAVVALLGVCLAPGIDLRALDAGILVAALFGVVRVHPLGDGNGRAEALRRIGAGLLRGAAIAAAGGVLIAVPRLAEQSRTLDPAVRGIYAQRGMFDHCAVRPAPGGRDGIALYKIDCGVGHGPTIGWDERTGTVIEGEALHARVPESAP